ncbi:MAG: class I SAM-dependent methyltransferase [Thermoleophilia bacterium]|nr:class I SAM-dependent methyltransferase [Thermoleophilia bacterium]
MSDHPVPASAGDWYLHFFTPLVNEFWRRVAPPADDDVAFIGRRLRLRPGARILDAPCGSGRHVVALAARGYRVAGVDASPEAVARARAACADAGLPARFSVADVRALEPDPRHDAVVCMGNSFGYFETGATAALCRVFAAVLRPGGGIVVDAGTCAESVLPGYADEESRRYAVGDISCTAHTVYHAPTSTIVSTCELSRGAERETRVAYHRVYTCGHIGEMLRAAGFADVALWSGEGDRPFSVGDRRLLVSARREG